jgi:TPR repeat protein
LFPLSDGHEQLDRRPGTHGFSPIAGHAIPARRQAERIPERTVMRLIFAFALVVALSLGASGAAMAQDDQPDAGSTAFNNGDYTGAMDAWLPKAKDSDPEAMTNIGTLYNLGLGVKRDDKAAADWYEKAAQLGFVLAQYDLANLYYTGQGRSRDLKQSARWYLAAAKGGHAKSQFYLAQMYESGEGVDRDENAALQWYGKAADQELPEAEYKLGSMLIAGEGIDVNPVKGADLVLKSAEQRYTKAQILIADCYWRGRAVEKNPIEAYVWASQAVADAKAGHDLMRARSLFQDVKSGMTGDQVKAAEIELLAVRPKPKKDSSGGGDSGSSSGTDAPQ